MILFLEFRFVAEDLSINVIDIIEKLMRSKLATIE